MIVFTALLALLCLYQIRFSFAGKGKALADGGTFNDYMSLESTNAVKGVFILIVFLNHAKSYLDAGGWMMKLHNLLYTGVIGQSMVSLFFLFSGFGVMYSVSKKGNAYVRSIPVKRFLKVLVHFDIAVLLYYVLDFILGEKKTFAELLIALTGWDNIGNSNWYIFAVLVLYLLSYAAFRICGNHYKRGCLLTLLLVIVYCALMWRLKPLNWYDTVLCYPLGMGLFLAQDKMDAFIKKQKFNYIMLLITVLALTAAFQIGYFKLGVSLFDIAKHLFFAAAAVLFTMKVKVNNKVLQFFGTHLFSVFILQRIPMIALSHIGIKNPFIFVPVCLAVTVLLCIPFDFALKKLDGVLFNKKA